MKVTLIEPKAPGKHRLQQCYYAPPGDCPILGDIITEGLATGAADHGFKQRYTSLGYYRLLI